MADLSGLNLVGGGGLLLADGTSRLLLTSSAAVVARLQPQWRVSLPDWRASLLPNNATAWEQTLEGVDTDLVSRDPTGLIPASRADAICPLAWLPYLALERSVDEYDGAWTESQRRQVVRESFGLHQIKGTRPVLDRALRPLGYALTILEWFEHNPVRPPYTFRAVIELGLAPWTAADRTRLVRTANKAKNAHTKLEAIETRRTFGPAMVYVGGVHHIKRTLRVGQFPRLSTIRSNNAYVYIGAANVIRRTLRVLSRAS